MTMTVPTAGVDVPHEGLDDALRREVAEIFEESKQAGRTDVNATLRALDHARDFIRAVDEARWPVAAEARELIKQALLAGVDPRDLYNRPFSDKIVRDLMTELNLPMPKRGPRPRRQPGTGTTR